LRKLPFHPNQTAMHHLNYDDHQFASQFADCTLPPPLFNHEAHLRLAWLLIGRYGIQQAAELLCRQIQAFDATHGDGTKYHKTMTVAAARAVWHFMQKTPNDTFTDFIAMHPRLTADFKGLLATHYGFDLLRHPTARQQYIAPDLLPFT